MNKLLLLVCGSLLSWNVNALEVAGIKLDDKVQVGNASLQLNGTGIRTRFFLKVYVAALYLPQKRTSAEMIIADELEHRVALHMLRELTSKKLLDAFNEAIEANHTPAELAALDTQLKQMAQIFGAMKEVKPGDVITLDYVPASSTIPASSTQISVNGTVIGGIVGPSFNRALLKIWLGSKPVQDDLKKGLLGG